MSLMRPPKSTPVRFRGSGALPLLVMLDGPHITEVGRSASTASFCGFPRQICGYDQDYKKSKIVTPNFSPNSHVLLLISKCSRPMSGENVRTVAVVSCRRVQGCSGCRPNTTLSSLTLPNIKFPSLIGLQPAAF